MKDFKVPVHWHMYGYITVKSDTLQHAAEIAASDMGLALPDNGEYVDGSWEVNWDIVEYENKEGEELIDFIQKLK
jgi:hypothetical protein